MIVLTIPKGLSGSLDSLVENFLERLDDKIDHADGKTHLLDTHEDIS